MAKAVLSVDTAPAAPGSPQRLDRFARIFDLPLFAEPSEAVKEALLDMGKPGGMLDARDDLSAGPLALITNPSLNVNNPDHPGHAAGITFFAEFLDHDMTFDLSARRPAFDLDTVYGHGPGPGRVPHGGLVDLRRGGSRQPRSVNNRLD